MGKAPGRLLHQAFEASLLLKGLFALSETLAGLGLYFIASDTIKNAVNWLAKAEIVEDPGDFIARHLIDFAHGFSIDTQNFFAFYLVSHGVVKLLMVGALWLRIAWAYPASIIVLLGFIAYQVHRYMILPSIALILLSILDIIVIWLIWLEYKAMRPRPASARRNGI